MPQIPLHASRVFQGKIFEVCQWEQKMFDGSTATFEMLRRPNTANVIAVVDDKIVICEQRQPDRPHAYLSLPGGRCEEDEDPLATAKRELLEETGYVSDDWVMFQEYAPEAKSDWTIFTYVARNCRKAQEPHLDAGEIITPRLLSFDDFLELSENDLFNAREIRMALYKARLHPQSRDLLHATLFPNS